MTTDTRVLILPVAPRWHRHLPLLTAALWWTILGGALVSAAIHPWPVSPIVALLQPWQATLELATVGALMLAGGALTVWSVTTRRHTLTTVWNVERVGLICATLAWALRAYLYVVTGGDFVFSNVGGASVHALIAVGALVGTYLDERHLRQLVELAESEDEDADEGTP